MVLALGGGDPGADEYREDKDDPPLSGEVEAGCKGNYGALCNYDIFVDTPGMARGWEHKIVMPQDLAVRTPVWLVPLALQQVLQQEIHKMLNLCICDD